MTKKNKKIEKEHRAEPCEQIWDLSTQCIMPISHNILNKWASDLREAAKNEEIITLEDWMIKKEISKATFNRLCEKHPALSEAKAYAKMAIGNRRWKGCAKFELNAAAVMPSMAHYDEDYCHHEERRARLRAQSNMVASQQGTVNVTMTQYPDCPDVPPLIEDV